MSPLVWIVVALVGFAFVIAVTQKHSPEVEGDNASANAVRVEDVGGNAAAPAEPASPKQPVVSNWNVSDDVDPMTDKVTHIACSTSKNEVHLNPPYSSVDARLCVRKSPKYGLDVFIALNGDGQILCRSYDGCTVHVRYDSGQRQAISASGASDGSSNVVFLNGESRIVEQLKSAESFKVELEFYEAGDQMLEFDTGGFEWGLKAAKK